MVLSLNLSREALPYKYIKAALGDSRGGQFDALISSCGELSIRLRESFDRDDQSENLRLAPILAPKNPANIDVGEAFELNVQRALALDFAS